MGSLQPATGSLFGNRFEIVRAAGSGGMGTVYRAIDRYSGDTVALKLLHAGMGGHDEAERFAREAQLLSELRHPGIVSHVTHGQTPDGQRFLAMEWLEGHDLGERGFLDLGDREGAERRLLALAPIMDKLPETANVGLWRHQLARVLCMANDEASWAKAEQLVAPLLIRGPAFEIFPILAQGGMARLSFLRGRLAEAEAQVRALTQQFFSVMTIWIAHLAPVHIRALLGLDRANEAVAVAVKFLDAIPMLGGYGIVEVEFRLAASEAFQASGDIERARAELRETLRQVQLRADDITDPFWKNSYLTRNPYVVRAQQLAKEWGVDAVFV